MLAHNALRIRQDAEQGAARLASVDREVQGYLIGRAARAGVPPPTLHSFRRAFALACLRNGAAAYSPQPLMGHADLSVLRRYLAHTEADLQRAHERPTRSQSAPTTRPAQGISA